MNIHYDCIPCSLNVFSRLVEQGIIPESAREQVFRRMLSYFAEVDFHLSPPALAQQTQRILRQVLADPDPYKKAKANDNQTMIKMLPYLEGIVKNAPNPFNTALRLAIAGNVIDFGAYHKLDIKESINKVLKVKLAIDDTARLEKEIHAADKILYIGDNAGEIVLDKIFIETINHPGLVFAVRGSPVLNDALISDALLLGIDKLATLTTTGDDAPGAILSTASEEFLHHFKTADVIISKGQGNFEALSDEAANIYFLLVTKCQLVADRIDVASKSFVVMSQTIKRNNLGLS